MVLPNKRLTLATYRRRATWTWIMIGIVEMAIIAIPAVWLMLTSLAGLIAGETGRFVVSLVILVLAPLLAIVTVGLGASRDVVTAEELL